MAVHICKAFLQKSSPTIPPHIETVSYTHLVFAPKYRRQVIYKDIKADVGQILGSLCRRKGIEIIAVSYTHLDVYKRQVCEICRVPSLENRDAQP